MIKKLFLLVALYPSSYIYSSLKDQANTESSDEDERELYFDKWGGAWTMPSYKHTAALLEKAKAKLADSKKKEEEAQAAAKLKGDLQANAESCKAHAKK